MKIFTSVSILQVWLLFVYFLLGVARGQQPAPNPLVLKTLNLHGDDIADIKKTMQKIIADNQALKNTVDQLKLDNAALKSSIQNFGHNLTQCCSHPHPSPTPTMVPVTRAPTQKTTKQSTTRTTQKTGVTLDPLRRCRSRLNITEGPIQTDGKYCYQLFSLQLTTTTPTDLCGQVKHTCASRGGFLSTAESEVLNSDLVPNHSYVLADEPHRSRRFMYYKGCVMWKKNYKFNVELVSYTNSLVIRAILQLLL